MNAPDPATGARSRHFRIPILRRLGPLAAVALAVAACGSGAAVLSSVGGSADNGEARAAGGAGGLAAPTAAPAALPQPQEPAPGQGSGDSSAVIGPLIVRTGQLDLQVTDLEAALTAAEQAVSAAGGYVASSQRQGDKDSASASVTYRIPAARWESTLVALRRIGAKVLSEQTASQEVTGQVVDLGARLTNLRATESALQAIMAKATKIPDVLEVQAQLSDVRRQIEQLTAEKQTLEEQAALATLTVAFSPPPVVAVAKVQEGWDPGTEVDRAAATLVGLAQGIASAAIWAAIVILPIAVVVGIVLGVAWVIARRFRGRPGAPAASSSPPAADAPAA